MKKIALIVAVLAIAAGPAMAEIDSFWGSVALNTVVTGGPSSWVPVGDWYAQWFDNPYNTAPGWYKTMTATIYITGGAGFPEFAMNWSASGYDDPINPPTDPDDIVISLFYAYPVLEGDDFTGEVEIGYCPAWVSVDVRSLGVGFCDFTFEGSLEHECLPEPATLALLGIGALAMIRRRRK